MTWRWEIFERDHEILNPTSAEKMRLLGELLRLGPDSRVLDIACGKCGPALILASSFGCHVQGVELNPVFVEAARERIEAAGLDTLITLEQGDAASFPLEREAWDVALCLGASFVWGTIEQAAARLVGAVGPGGGVAIGEPFWSEWPLRPEIDDLGFVGLEQTVARFESAGLVLTGMIAASRDDWDRYESLHWRAVQEWLGEHPDDPDADEMREGGERFRSDYLRFQRALLGWAIFVGRRPAS